MKSNTKIIEKMKIFFRNPSNLNILEKNKSCTEPDLLINIAFESNLSLLKGKKMPALFGYESIQSDYITQDDRTIIEVKYITQVNHNECEIKNALSQIIEQAISNKTPNAILLILDAGRACEREWTKKEKKFVSIFQKNKFKIKLSVLRVQMLEKNNSFNVLFEVIK